ncbi:MAG: type II secretion system protein [Oligoflexales bacterium]|nr:type II secretion system protein [Oligoflexales bacterium]
MLWLRRNSRAFTLIEILIVISLLAITYTMAAPSLGLQQETQVAHLLSQLNTDIRSAFDAAVLNKKAYRMVFHLQTGDYWLEEADRADFYLGADKILSEPSTREEEERYHESLARFEKFEELVGEPITQARSDEKIKQVSCVINAKADLTAVRWSRVNSEEWSEKRTLGSILIIKDMQAEHHPSILSLESLGPEAHGRIYFLPIGYVEKAFMHIFYRLGDDALDQEKQPYTLVTQPYAGESIINSGYDDIDLQKLDDES